MAPPKLLIFPPNKESPGGPTVRFLMSALAILPAQMKTFVLGFQPNMEVRIHWSTPPVPLTSCCPPPQNTYLHPKMYTATQ